MIVSRTQFSWSTKTVHFQIHLCTESKWGKSLKMRFDYTLLPLIVSQMFVLIVFSITLNHTK